VPPSGPSGANGPQASSIAMQAARNAYGSPAAPPPPPPPSAPAAQPPPPPTSPPSSARTSSLVSTPLSSRPSSFSDNQHTAPHHQPPVRSMLDPSTYTLTNGGSHRPGAQKGSSHGRIRIEDPRFKFQNESLFPKPREFIGGQKMYRAGRGSSVPLDLTSLS
ncbi:hypothetical protein H101_06221, partial [Trichophyton interdigitale H6]